MPHVAANLVTTVIHRAKVIPKQVKKERYWDILALTWTLWQCSHSVYLFHVLQSTGKQKWLGHWHEMDYKNAYKQLIPQEIFHLKCTQNFPKKNNIYSLIRTGTYACQGVRNDNLSETFAYALSGWFSTKIKLNRNMIDLIKLWQ